MSKKKSSSGNTMTLKDFHGGSIPSDLPLPSAPGLIVRPTDHRQGFDRQTNWSNPMSRSDHRLRPGSSGSVRNNLDDKTPFLTNTAHIGRNFDEDERKPLDGGASGPRRTVSDEGNRGPVMRSEPKAEVGRFAGQHGLGPVVVPQVGAASASSYSARVVEGGHSGVHSGVGSRPNAWGVRKDAVVVAEPVPSPWIGQSTVSKFAQASALDQISSGRWQTKPTHHQADIEVIRQSDSLNSLYSRESDSYSGVNFVNVSEREYYENTLVRHVERSLSIEDGIQIQGGGVKEMPGVERVRSPVMLDGKERSPVLFTNDGQPAYPDGKHAGSESQLSHEVSRPKLKLLPRTKPLDTPEPSGVEFKQGFQQPSDAIHTENGGHIHLNSSHVKAGLGSSEVSHVKAGLSSSEAGNQPVERPKLNLKPRSQPLDKADGSTERGRMSVFGGARPREMVLKERGVDDIVNSLEEVQSPNRFKSEAPRTEMAPAHANTSRHAGRVENLPDRAGRGGHEKREQRADVQKADVQRKNWRNNDNSWRNNNSRDPHPHPEKPHHQQPERPPSPDTWRKPVESAKPAGPDSSSGLRFGKAVSAVELAQAFSRPASDPKPKPKPKPVDQFPSQRGGFPSRANTQMPFSRLTGPTSRPQINGY